MHGKKQINPCPMCTSLIDGLNGVAHHLAQIWTSPSLPQPIRAPCERMLAPEAGMRYAGLDYAPKVRAARH